MSVRRSIRIAFVEVPSPWLVRPKAQVAMGPVYLATILNQHGHSAILFRPSCIDDCRELEGADAIAFTGTTLEYPQVAKFAAWCRQHVPDAKLWYGGPHATAMPEEVRSEFDSVGVGEGEGYIVQMADDQAAGQLHPTYHVGRFADLNELPHPDRTLIVGSHGGDIFAFGDNYSGSGNENVIASRGCSYSCAFCASKSMWGQKVRFRTPENVAAEIRNIVESTGCRQIRFADDHFAASRRQAMRTCEAIRPMEVIWRCSIRLDSLSDELCKAMYDAGCREISVGIESGDQRVLEFLDKRTNLEVVRRGCEIASRAGIHVRALMMIGTPGENPDTPELTRDFLKTIEFHAVTLSTFLPLPGTAVWSDPERFDCEILSRDFSLYNKDFWVREGEEKKKRTYEPLIWNRLLTMDQQLDNVRRMEQYVLETGRSNIG